MKPRSAKREAELPDRRQLVADVLHRRPYCEMRVVCDGAYSQDVHEVLTRGRGGDYLDAANVLAVCRACHDWQEAHPAESLCRGFVVPSWAFTVVDDPMGVAAALRAGTGGTCPWRDPLGACHGTETQKSGCRPAP